MRDIGKIKAVLIRKIPNETDRKELTDFKLHTEVAERS